MSFPERIGLGGYGMYMCAYCTVREYVLYGINISTTYYLVSGRGLESFVGRCRKECTSAPIENAWNVTCTTNYNIFLISSYLPTYRNPHPIRVLPVCLPPDFPVGHGTGYSSVALQPCFVSVAFSNCHCFCSASPFDRGQWFP